jgi:hypothetical protein
MPSTDRKLESKARHRWLRPPHRRLCINQNNELSRLTGSCVGQRVKYTEMEGQQIESLLNKNKLMPNNDVGRSLK